MPVLVPPASTNVGLYSMLFICCLATVSQSNTVLLFTDVALRNLDSGV